MGRRDYHRIADLFTVGTVLRPHPDADVVWLQKLNRFEQDEARRVAQVRRSLAMRALQREGGLARTALLDSAHRRSAAELVELIAADSYIGHMATARNAIYADPDWHEQLDTMDRLDLGQAADADEFAVLDELNQRFLTELHDRTAPLVAAQLDELGRLDLEKVRARYVDSYIEARGQAVYTESYQCAEIAHGVRMCRADPDADTPDHGGCRHDRVYVDEERSRERVDGTTETYVEEAVDQVRQLPDDLRELYIRAFGRLNVPRDAAKGSARRRTSSVPSRPQPEEEVSTASTQEASEPPAGISASPSTTP